MILALTACVSPDSEPSAALAERVPPDRSAYAGCVSVEVRSDREVTTTYDELGWPASFVAQLDSGPQEIGAWEGRDAWGHYTRYEWDAPAQEYGSIREDATYDGASWVHRYIEFTGTHTEYWYDQPEPLVEVARVEESGYGESYTQIWRYDPQWHLVYAQTYGWLDRFYEWDGDRLVRVTTDSLREISEEDWIYADDGATEPILIEEVEIEDGQVTARFRDTWTRDDRERPLTFLHEWDLELDGTFDSDGTVTTTWTCPDAEVSSAR